MTNPGIYQPWHTGSDPCPIILGGRDEKRFGAAIAAQAPQLDNDVLKVMPVIKGQAGLYSQCRKACGIGDARKPMDKDLGP